MQDLIIGKDLIIGAYTNYDWNKIKYWVNSINRSGFDGYKMMIAFNSDKDTVKRLVDSGFSVIAFNENENGYYYNNTKIPIHVERFFHIWDVLSKIKEKIRYVITTDVKDVVFQENPSKRIEEYLGFQSKYNLMAASESMRYMDEPWGNQNLHESFGAYFHEKYKTNLIYNVGVIAGDFEYVRDLCLQIFQTSINRPIPIVDQAVYNFLLWQKPISDITMKLDSESGWAAQLGTTMDPTKIGAFKPFLTEPSPIMIDDIVKTNGLIPYCIVHQWDRVPALHDMIERKYG
jgi:hypothetical protein